MFLRHVLEKMHKNVFLKEIIWSGMNHENFFLNLFLGKKVQYLQNQALRKCRAHQCLLIYVFNATRREIIYSQFFSINFPLVLKPLSFFKTLDTKLNNDHV